MQDDDPILNHHGSPTANIIGAGVAGLATAIRLAVKGYEVTVFEKNAYAGGKLNFFEKDGYKFDAGPSLFTQPQNIEALFELADEPISDYFNYQTVAAACNYFFENGKQVVAVTDHEQFARNLHEALGEDPGSVINYLADAEKAYKNIGEFFVTHSLHRAQSFLTGKLLKALSGVNYSYFFKSLHEYNQARLKTPEAVQLFDRYATYNGSNPFKAPGILSLIPHLELTQGTYYPMGGMISITNALQRLAEKKGVHFRFNSCVDRIIHHEGRAGGVVVNGENYFSDIVVSDCDVFFTYKRLLDDEDTARKVLKQERSSSALIFYWGINKSFAQTGLHNVLFSNDYKAEFDHIFNKGTLHEDPTVYINITSKMEPEHAPAGCENWFVMINAPADKGQDWKTMAATTRRQVIEKINRIFHTDIEPLVATETILDPSGIEKSTASYMGSLYGTSSNSRLAAFFRHPNFTNTIKGLYFVGGSVHPGGGIPLCLNSAKIVSDLL